MTGLPVLVDLCCKQGGTSMGYHRAGFDVFGIDRDAQPRYPFPFYRRDVTKLTAADLAAMALETYGRPLAAVAGSAPCQTHTSLRSMSKPGRHVDILSEVRALARSTGLPYILENVPGAPLLNPVTLCGTEFRLTAETPAGRRWVKRHRLFESNVMLLRAGVCTCRDGRLIGGAYGTGGGGPMTRGYKFTVAEAKVALGIDWMTGRGMSQAVPPAYTEHLGAQLAAHVEGIARSVAA